MLKIKFRGRGKRSRCRWKLFGEPLVQSFATSTHRTPKTTWKWRTRRRRCASTLQGDVVRQQFRRHPTASSVRGRAGYETVSKSDGTNPFILLMTRAPGPGRSTRARGTFLRQSTHAKWLRVQSGAWKQHRRDSLFQLVPDVSSGTFLFRFRLAVKGDGTGGLSDMVLYAEPGRRRHRRAGAGQPCPARLDA